MREQILAEIERIGEVSGTIQAAAGSASLSAVI
jgi:hypothetical protein